MGYQECYKETNELAAERYELVAERIAEIAEAAQAPEPFAEYFRTMPHIYRAFVHCMKKEKAAVLRRGAWRNVRRTMRRSTGRSCRKPTDTAMRIRPTPLHVWERRSAERSRFLRHIFGRHAGRFSVESGAAYDRDGAVCGGLQLL